jgi:hypothetical protein
MSHDISHSREPISLFFHILYHKLEGVMYHFLDVIYHISTFQMS